MLNGVARVTGFEDEDGLVGILGEAGGKDETRETTAGDDEVCSGSAARWGTETRERRKAKLFAVSRNTRPSESQRAPLKSLSRPLDPDPAGTSAAEAMSNECRNAIVLAAAAVVVVVVIIRQTTSLESFSRHSDPSYVRDTSRV